jgi:hypothetical protein
MKNEINLRIILQKPPKEVDFGLQMGHANKYKVVGRQKATGDDLTFEFAINAKPGKDSAIDFSGLFVQGPIGGRFIYINIGQSAGQIHSRWNRRLKIPLIGITQSQIDEILKTSGVFETSVPGTGKDGGPNCATVKPFAGWSVVKNKKLPE